MRDFDWTSGAMWLLQLRLLGAWAITTGVKLLAIFLLYWIARRFLARAIDQLLPSLLSRTRAGTPLRESRVLTIGSLLKRVCAYLLLFITGVMALGALHLEVTPIVASAGVVGLAVGFGAQKLVKDVITGFLMLVEDQFDVGDTVTISGNTGVVEEIGMRITRLRDDVGKLIILSNGDISTVINHSRGPLSVTVDVAVAPETPMDRLREIVSGLALPEGVWADSPSVRGVVAMDATKITVRVAGRAEPGQQSAAELGLRQALHDALTGAGMKLA
jgi:small-conductance mechanosensitive channel